MHGSVQVRQRQVNATRRLVVGGLAQTDRWQTEVDEVATVNQYEQVNLFPVLWLLRGSYHIYNHNKSVNQRWKFTEIARQFPGMLLQTQR